MKKNILYDAYIFEYKVGVLTLEQVMDTIYLKDYINCIVNGTNNKVRSVAIPLRNIYKHIKTKLLRQPKLDKVTVIFLADRISIQAAQYINKINKANKYIYRASTGQQVSIKIAARTYKDYLILLDKNYIIQWNHLKSINKQIINFSKILPINQFPKWSEQGEQLGYWEEHELLDY